MTFQLGKKTKIITAIAAFLLVGMLFILYSITGFSRTASDLMIGSVANHVPDALAVPVGTTESVETMALPITMTSVFLPAQAKIAVGAGAIEVLGQQVIVLDRLGHLFSYSGGKVVNSLFPDLPMHGAEYLGRPGVDVNNTVLRAHDLRYHEGFLFASYDAYDRKTNTTHFEISKIRVRQGSVVPEGSWSVIFKGDILQAGYYRPGRSAGGALAFSNDTLYFAVGDYNLNYTAADPAKRQDFSPAPGPMAIGQAGQMPAAQDRTTAFGKIFGYNLKNDTLREISFGHRVEEGLAVTARGELLETENAERGGDKLNRILQDGNYGWPYEIWGTNYETYNSDDRVGVREVLHRLTQFIRTGFGISSWVAIETKSLDQGSVIDPVYAWLPSIAPSAVIEIKDFHPAWNGDLLVGSLKAQSLFRLRYKDGRVIFSERIWIGHRIRSIVNLHGQLIIWTDDGSLVFLSVADKLLAANRIGEDSAYANEHFAQCVDCHSFAPNNRYYWTPSLRGVFGRQIASDAFPGYSAALKAKKGVWTEETLAAFLSSPEDFAPGTTMPNLGLSAQDILQTVADLKAEKYQDTPSAGQGH